MNKSRYVLNTLNKTSYALIFKRVICLVLFEYVVSLFACYKNEGFFFTIIGLMGEANIVIVIV